MYDKYVNLLHQSKVMLQYIQITKKKIYNGSLWIASQVVRLPYIWTNSKYTWVNSEVTKQKKLYIKEKSKINTYNYSNHHIKYSTYLVALNKLRVREKKNGWISCSWMALYKSGKMQGLNSCTYSRNSVRKQAWVDCAKYCTMHVAAQKQIKWIMNKDGVLT